MWLGRRIKVGGRQTGFLIAGNQQPETLRPVGTGPEILQRQPCTF